MIVLSRALARQLRAVLRHSLMEKGPRSDWPPLVCRSGPSGLVIQSQRNGMALAFHQPGNLPEATLVFSAAVLAEFEANKDEAVALHKVGDGKGKAEWTEGAMPRVIEFDVLAADSVPAFPGLPKRTVGMPADFLPTFHEASMTADHDSVRFAMELVQLRGKNGQMVATDGRQLLLHSGFRFPWSDDVLIRRTSVFGKKGLLPPGPVHIGKTDKHVAVKVGNQWTFLWEIDRTSRFPNTDAVLPNPKSAKCRFNIDPDDATFLISALPKLPGKDHMYKPVTLDLEQPPKVRAKDCDSEAITEVELSRSTVDGKAQRLCIDRTYFRRALQLGFRTVHVAKPDKPIWCSGEQRLYLWVPLGPDVALAPAGDMMRMSTASTAPSPASPPPQPKKRRSVSMPAPNGRQSSRPNPKSNGAEQNDHLVTLINEAEELRGVLQEANGRVSHLITALKQQRKHSRAFRAAVASLRQLNIDG